MFEWVRTEKGIENLAAPIAKMWAASALVFDQGFHALPAGAGNALLIGAAIGVAYTLLELVPVLHRWLPHSVGIGLGLVLHPSLGLAFFVGGFIFWIVLGRWMKVSESTLTTIAVGSIVAEGIGGVLKPVLTLLGVPGI
jgi:uncharacterized oligopeptide transporter (OPT) family protein